MGIAVRPQTGAAPQSCHPPRACRLRGCHLRPTPTCTIAMLDTTTACTVWWSLGLHRRSITAARTSTRVAGARSRSEQAAGVRCRIEAAWNMYVHNEAVAACGSRWTTICYLPHAYG